MLVFRSSRRTLVVVAAVMLFSSLFARQSNVNAQDATPVNALPPIPANCSVFASGLLNPRFLTFGPDETLYVTEAGNAGDEEFFAPAGEGTPESTAPITTAGPSGQVTAIAPDGTKSILATGLPSHSFGTEVIGAAGIVFSDGKLYVAVGGPGPAAAVIPPAPNRESVVSIDPATGAVTLVADVGAYERANNPDPNAVDTDLYGLTAGSDGNLYVADAGGNAVYKVDPASGEVTLLAVVPGLPSPGGAANEARGGQPEIDPVPTGVAPAPDGGVYVGLLSGGPFIPGTAKIIHIAQDGTITDVAVNVTMVAGVTVGPDGAIYAAQISENFLGDPPALGSIIRVGDDGVATTVLPGLLLPNDVAFGPDGMLYVVTITTSEVGLPPMGQVLRCDLSAGAATPTTGSGAPATPVAVR